MTDWSSRFRLPNWKHQDDEWEHRDDAGRMWRWQMRTGKTKAAIDLSCYRYERGEIDAVLVAAPNNVHANWPRKQFPLHVWKGLRWKAITWDAVKSRNVSWAQEFREALEFDGLLFLCVNAEAFQNPRFRDEFLKPFMKRRKRFGFIGDETHDLSRRVASKKSKAIRAVAHKAVFRRGLSGTITDNDPMHAYGQYELIAKGALGFASYTECEEKYAEYEDVYVPGGRKIKRVCGYHDLEDLRERMAKWTSVVLRSDCDDLPALIEGEVGFEMTPEQKRLYNDVCRDGLVRLDGGEVIPPKEAGALVIQLQQIASGWVVDEDGEVHDVVPLDRNPRMLALMSELALVGPKAIVWCRYREDIVRVVEYCKRRGYKPVHYYGGTSKRDRARHEDLFQTHPDVGPMVGQPRACGQGLDFSAATDIIHYSHLHGDRIARMQADERATQKGGRRIGVTNLVAAGSNDERMLEDMDRKGEVSEFVSGEGLKRYLEFVR